MSKNKEIHETIDKDLKNNTVTQDDINFMKKVNSLRDIELQKESGLKLIPVFETYMLYMIHELRKIPRSEKFSLGTEFKQSMYSAYRDIMMVEKVEDRNKLYYLNKIDAELNVERGFVRLMFIENWISKEKFEIIMKEKIFEVGNVLRGINQVLFKSIYEKGKN